jgi:hypothetical protein
MPTPGNKGAKMAQHTLVTASIQRRLERWELDHLRALCAVQAEEIERLHRDLQYAENCADMWQRIHDITTESPACKIGLTVKGEIVPVEGEALL